jgi:hypothetical protein
MTYRILIFFFLFSCSGPSQTDFYRDEMADYDVWRLPVIKPYQLVTARCCEDWSIGGIKTQDNNYFSSGIDSIGFGNGTIVFFADSSPVKQYGVFNIESEKLEIFYSREVFMEYKKKLKISVKMYRDDDVYREWKQTKKLPWDTTWVGEKKAG